MTQPLFAPRRSLADEVAFPAAEPRGSLDRGREAAALLLFASSLYLGLALASYRADPRLVDVQGADWVGPVGAAIAQGLVATLGLVAWCVPLEMALFAAPLLRGRASIANVARLAGDVLVSCIAAALLHVAVPAAVAFGAMPIAGSFGELFGEVLRSLFSTVGSYLVGLTAVGLILIGRASFSFISWAQRAGRGTEMAAQRAAGGARAVAGAWAEAREIERRRGESEARTPRIAQGESDDAIVAVLSDDVEPERPSPRMMLSASSITTEFDTPTPPPSRARSKAPRVMVPPPPAEPLAPASADAPADDDPRCDADRSPVPEMMLDGEAPSELDEPAAPPAAPRAPRKKKAIGGPVVVDTSEQLQVHKAEPQKLVPALGQGFRLPLLEFLDAPPPRVKKLDDGHYVKQAELLVKTLADYGVAGTVDEIHPGPTVTTYEVSPQAGTKVSKVASLADDLALGLSRKVRIIAPIPGKNRIGFEIQNEVREPVSLRELIEDERFLSMGAPLPVVLGRDHVGAPYFADLASMPHVIVAGATGAGKSVGLNVMLTSLLYRKTPEDLRLLMIDPKVVELAPFDRIPHMLLPVVTDMKQAANALKWAVDEMERRYQMFANAGTKNISTYNGWVERVKRGEAKAPPPPKRVQAIGADGEAVEVDAAKDGTDAGLPDKLPFIVIVVDEFADLMMQQGKDVEVAVARLAQKARAAGMHVILATQRPSVDVITGMIKANFPTRIAFRVAQRVDSRTILDEQGAEHLLGRGDMLVKMNGTNDTRRVQCPFVSEEEVQKVTDFLRLQGEPVYDENILKPRDEDGCDPNAEEEDQDPLYDQAVRIVADTRRCSTSWLQRKLNLGYNRAARIVEAMEKHGLVGPSNGAREREVLISPQ